MRMRRGSLEGSGQAAGKSDSEVDCSLLWRYLGTRGASQQGRVGVGGGVTGGVKEGWA